MRIGLMVSTSVPDGTGLEAVVDLAVEAESDGLSTLWTSGRYDALTQLALIAGRTKTIELGTGVVQTHLRHPVALAQQALAVQVVSGGRVALGIGVSHQSSMEGLFGLDWSTPIRHVREYLQCLGPLLAGSSATFEGVEYTINGYSLPVAQETAAPPVIVAALGPQMLRLAGRLASGTIVWLGGERYLRDAVVPEIESAAERAGHPRPRIVAGVPVLVTDDAAAGREYVMSRLGRMGNQPVYRAILERDGSENVADVSLVGNESELRDRLGALETAGVTDFAAQIVGRDEDERARTYRLLCDVARSGAS